MTATAAQIAQVRRMVNESGTDTYTDDDIQTYIEAHPLLDERGEVPYTWDTSTSPPTQDDNDDWIPTYDLHCAAADIWEEKAAVVAQDFRFNADGGSYERNQVYTQYMGAARYHRARRKPSTHTLHQFPEEYPANTRTWVANLAEEKVT